MFYRYKYFDRELNKNEENINEGLEFYRNY